MRKPYSVSVHRDMVHPWTGEPGWDLMFIKALNERTEDKVIEKAEAKGWKMLLTGFDDGPEENRLYMTLMYKPSARSWGNESGWADPRPWPHQDHWV